MEAVNVYKENEGLRVVAYPGDNKILIAMSLADTGIDEGDKNLAGIAIWRKYAGKPEQVLANRIGFDYGVQKDTTTKDRKWTGSDQAPFQKFRWIDVPPDGFDAPVVYRVLALYFVGKSKATKAGPEVTIEVAPVQKIHARFHPAFTRGYIPSQAYADKFQNKDIRPPGAKTPDFDTKPFQRQYEWLGADARVQLNAFIADCEKDRQSHVDVFAYDLDEPDVIAAICRMGKEGRLRTILDNAPLHSKAGKDAGMPPEVKAAQMIIAAAGKDKVRQRHFSRFQHNKVFIKRDATGKAQRVLFGSMNFSVRGLYVQANNVIVVDDANVAGMFATAFDTAFANNVATAPFAKSAISQGYMVGSPAGTADLPKFSVALSPHKDGSVSLGPMSERIRAATSSVLFAVMEPSGQGPVLDSLRVIAATPTVFSYGTVETDKGLGVQNPDGGMGEVTSFAALTKNVPEPFTKEFSGGPGMHIHDKFVVVDFNAGNPTVFTGSSNLAAGGEEANGDSLVMIEDEAIANMYAIEAVALFDHSQFRKVMQGATKVQPFTLWYPGKPGAPNPWWKPYFDTHDMKFRDRYLFADLPLPAGLESVKKVDWASLAAPAAKGKAKPARSTKSGPSGKKTTAKKAAKPARKTAKAKSSKKTAKRKPASKTASRTKAGTGKAKARKTKKR
jgi:PLD-like domain